MLRAIRWAASGLAAALAIAWCIVWMAQADPDGRAAILFHGIAAWTRPLPPAPALGAGLHFSLTDSQGRPVTDQTYRGKWMLVYFGYTYCPDVCPAMLQTISDVLDQLGDQAAQIVPIFITVDPERDTPVVIGGYVSLFDQRFIGLTGTPRQVADVEATYRVYARRVNSPKGDGYMIDHSSYLYLQGPDGKLKALFKDGIMEADMVVAITAAMSQRG